MTQITRWEPLREMATLTDRMNRLFDEVWGRPFRRSVDEEGAMIGAWAPAVDVLETKDGLQLTAELPGIDPKNVEVTVENGVLSVRGERSFEKAAEGETYHRVERVYGTFERSFTLPTSVDPDKIKAQFKNGLLTLTIPKREEAKPKPIKIQVESK
ncbi:MAG: Hsp20/alpha crystallin family protein [Acidobacteria bacterium]|nr:Hsp20/alpha crystallin family protein [Acidobacteriota bacterium]